MSVLKRIVAAVGAVSVIAAVLVVGVQSDKADAASASDFQAGNLISDTVFFNGSSMSAGDVQSFLNAAVGACRSGYTCLKDFRQATPNRGAVSGRCSAYSGSGSESAAQIIAKVGSACGISQKAIIVLLEKEQSLITDNWPTDRQYRSAMGYGCPDTADCDTEYYGFFNQVYAAALQFKNYAANPTRWNHVAGRVNSIRFNPNAACGSSSVYIQNQATAGLYNYTPYQPNASALANLYGTGDGCGAYGNRNFWRIFSDWFGNPTGGPDPKALIDWEYAAQGGPAGSLGTATSDYLTVSANGGGMARAYQNGSIYWGATTGVAALTVRAGPIRDYYFAQGGASGAVGWPILNAGPIASNGGGTGQVYSGGSVFSSAAGTFLVGGKQREAYFSQGGAAGDLAWPISDQRCASVGAVPYCYQGFQGGGTYYNDGTGARPVSGAVYAAYAVAGGPGGSWGLPTSGLLQYAEGAAQAFYSTSVYAKSGRLPIPVSGAIRDVFFTYGGAGSGVGWPMAAASCSGNPSTCSQQFDRGFIMQNSGQPPRVGAPELDAAYAAAGGAGGALGSAAAPISVLYANGGGLGQAYRGGSIFWKAGLGAFPVSGPVRDFYFAQGGANGTLAFPAGTQSCTGASCSQVFEGGTVFTGDGGAGTSTGSLAVAYAAAGGSNGGWGGIRSGVLSVTENGGGTAQVFANGSAYAATGSGAFFVSGGVRTAYFAAGGAAGKYGWPTGAQTCDQAGRSCQQAFQGGTIYWDTALGTASVSGVIQAAYAASNGTVGPWGFPVGDTSTIGALPAVAQAFKNGSVYSKDGASAYFVPSGPVRDLYFSYGGATGAFGWPTSANVCQADRSCRQAFEGGAIQTTPDGVVVRQ